VEAFQDILAAGAALSGGYVGTIDTTHSKPLLDDGRSRLGGEVSAGHDAT